MKVLDHEPQCWFLLEEAGALFLDGNYSHSALTYDWMIQLSPAEMEQYRQHGREFIRRLVEDIQNSAPLVAGASVYKTRRVSPDVYDRASAVIQRWRESL